MSTTKCAQIDKNAIGWQRLIEETRKRIERLELAIEVFEENIRTGFPFEGDIGPISATEDTKTGTAKKAIPA